MVTRMMLGQTLQTGYATDDLDQACALFQARYGIGEFYRGELNVSETEAGETMAMQIAHAWRGNSWLEIIQPVDGAVAIYRDWLPPGGGVRFHHLGVIMDTAEAYQAVKRDALASGRKISFSIAHPSGLGVFYLDTTADLGHYMEYLYFPDLAMHPLSHLTPSGAPPTP
jgi:hypothetical protein